MVPTPTRRTVLKGAGLAGLALLTAGTATATPGPGGDAKLRVAHASPDAPAVDVFANDAKVLADVPFGAVSGYLEVPAGEYDVAIAAASDATSPDEAAVVVFDGTVTFDAEDYTAVAVGNLSPEGSEPGFAVDLFTDKLGVLGREDGRVRIYHASPDAPAVDVRVVGGPTLAADLEFGEAGPNADVPAGTYPVAVYPADSTDPVFGPVDVEVRDGEVLTVFAMGELDPEGDEPTFGPVLAYEEAAPFGRGRDRARDRVRR